MKVWFLLLLLMIIGASIQRIERNPSSVVEQDCFILFQKVLLELNSNNPHAERYFASLPDQLELAQQIARWQQRAVSKYPAGSSMGQLLQLFATSLSERETVALNLRWNRIYQKLQTLRPKTRGLQNLTELRVKNSSTLLGRYSSQIVEQETLRWMEAEGMIKAWIKNGDEISLDKIVGINHQLGGSQLRRAGVEVFSDDSQNALAYLDGKYVEAAMQNFMDWYTNFKDHIPPIELAARAYQKLISIHPFHDGNGRTARLVMNWILQKSGFPPVALLSSEIDVALFVGGRSKNITLFEVVERVTKGMERSIMMLSQ